jgi:hypothetical protein
MSLPLRPEQPLRLIDLSERFTASGEQAKAVPLLVVVFLVRQQAEFPRRFQADFLGILHSDPSADR